MSTKAGILQQLRSEILTLELKPGSILSETVLSERFKISRTPLRDVLKQLAHEGYIDVYPKRGNLVSYIDLESVEQIIYLRSILEKDIIKNLAAQNVSLPLRGILELREILNKQAEAIRQDHAHEAFLFWDDAFHKALFALAGRVLLWDLIQQSNAHYARYRRLHLLKKEKLEEILDEHRLILECIVNRDAERIDDLVRHHLHEDINAAYLLENFAEYLNLPRLEARESDGASAAHGRKARGEAEADG
ncbi:GntR family transcriptional regulator [Saccharibacillus sp. CPCC 101409]|uniref:GntR family transcriptional regulator n=1 Tax=Saccharibacillus sp. CPCC 101409 TaxID=3058041 RepID=UPI0026738771|nr:GntR family transcriptional regulator [Saccharibacillus sp. CPCC 101409]MDO3410129.1 GntR family transcriptional regulator [Saccharibacillus sp. CPCC 101409]